MSVLLYGWGTSDVLGGFNPNKMDLQRVALNWLQEIVEIILFNLI